jgi:TetR/AcrR family transcriptional regulator, copper-responsive repressor
VSGKPQYDVAAVVDAAMDVYWGNGYAAASINDLTAATGLSRSSLYQRFGDKDGLFLEVLETYVDRVATRMCSVQGDSMRETLLALLREFLPREGNRRRPPGCLLARSCSEMEHLSTSARARVRAGVERQREVIKNILRTAISRGELHPDADLDAMSWHFLGVLQAITNLPQVGAALPMLERVIEVAMSPWPSNSATT